MVFSKKSYAKVNIFLKIVGYKNGYHKILSRFMRVKSLYDKITFIPVDKELESFTVEGFEDLHKENNLITKAFYALNRATGNLDILDFFYKHKVYVEKNIPLKAGLGGGSSNAGTFINMVNEICNLKLSKDELAEIGAEVGSDVPFFIYEFDSANVSGFGEVVEPFNEELLNLEIFTPKNIECDTGRVYKKYRELNLNRDSSINIPNLESWKDKTSSQLLREIQNAKILNDLFTPALELCPELKKYENDSKKFFSGSGSSFFTLKV